MGKQVEQKVEKCFWRIDGVDSNGDIIVRVFNADKQKELNALTGQAKAKYTKEQNKLVKQDDHYAELVDVLGFEAVAELFSTAGKAYVHNVKRAMAKDAKAGQAKKALLDGAAEARQARAPKADKPQRQTLIMTEVGAW